MRFPYHTFCLLVALGQNTYTFAASGEGDEPKNAGGPTRSLYQELRDATLQQMREQRRSAPYVDADEAFAKRLHEEEALKRKQALDARRAERAAHIPAAPASTGDADLDAALKASLEEGTHAAPVGPDMIAIDPTLTDEFARRLHELSEDAGAAHAAAAPPAVTVGKPMNDLERAIAASLHDAPPTCPQGLAAGGVAYDPRAASHDTSGSGAVEDDDPELVLALRASRMDHLPAAPMDDAEDADVPGIPAGATGSMGAIPVAMPAEPPARLDLDTVPVAEEADPETAERVTQSEAGRSFLAAMELRLKEAEEKAKVKDD